MCSLRLVSYPLPLIFLLIVFLSQGVEKHRHVQFVPSECPKKHFRRKARNRKQGVHCRLAFTTPHEHGITLLEGKIGHGKEREARIFVYCQLNFSMPSISELNAIYL